MWCARISYLKHLETSWLDTPLICALMVSVSWHLQSWMWIASSKTSRHPFENTSVAPVAIQHRGSCMRPLELQWIPSTCAESWSTVVVRSPFEVRSKSVRTWHLPLEPPRWHADDMQMTCRWHAIIFFIYCICCAFLFIGHVSEATKCLLTGKFVQACDWRTCWQVSLATFLAGPGGFLYYIPCCTVIVIPSFPFVLTFLEMVCGLPVHFAAFRTFALLPLRIQQVAPIPE